ncbi:uncharacterized protein LOC120342647 [Styela clava]
MMLMNVLIFEFLIFEVGYSLTCYQGFNVSLAGVPLSRWKEHECEKNSICFIQEFSINIRTTKLHVAMRYGGCVKEEYSDDWTCQQIFGPDSTLDIDDYMDGLRALDDTFRDTLAGLKAELISMLLMVEGADEIINGFVVFFGNIGFEKQRFEAPLRKLARDPINPNNLADFAKSLLVDNELTRRLSHATSKFLYSVYETKKESETSIIFSDLMKYGCGLVYPIANYVFPKSDVDSVYDAVARGLESTQSGPVDDLSELQVEGLMWYLHLLHMQVVQHDLTKSKPIYQAVAKIIDDYKKMYPEFVVPRIIEIFGKETRKYVKGFL